MGAILVQAGTRDTSHLPAGGKSGPSIVSAAAVAIEAVDIATIAGASEPLAAAVALPARAVGPQAVVSEPEAEAVA